MVKKILIACALAAGSALLCQAQENQVNRLPEVDNRNAQKVYTENETGFWCSAEAVGAYSCRLFNSNFSLAEVDFTGGYRFNEYLRVGIGIGGRYYFDNSKVRYTSSEWAFPLYANVRGNFIPTQYRSVVPFYSFDLGGTIRDGFMMRPTVGIRVGQERHAFLLGVGYTGQDLKSFEINDMGHKVSKRKFVSFVTLKLGYEF